MTIAQRQLSIDLDLSFPPEAYEYGSRASGATHGVVLTKPHVVELILDMAGYQPSRDLTRLTLLEPACGEGAFVRHAVRRLCEARRCHERNWDELHDAFRSFDIDAGHVEVSREAARDEVRAGGASENVAADLARSWIRQGDFLLSRTAETVDFVVGNPPYIRIEQIAPELQAVYRNRFRSLYDRADLYVAFIEHGLQQLSETGTLVYICADRWTSNRYGARLRELITTRYRVKGYVDLHTASPFESEVIAYPAIFSIGRGPTKPVRVARLNSATAEECATVGQRMIAEECGPGVAQYTSWFEGSEPWVLSSPEHLKVLRSLERRFDVLEADGSTRVGIGVATGNDKIFIVDATNGIESDRLVPLVMRADIHDGHIRDNRRFVINTFADEGGTVDLGQYPGLARYVRKNAESIKGRHVAKKNPRSWFRTIDRVYPALVQQPKLLIPDIAGSLQVTFDEGRFHPHHNLYFVVSGSWDLETLGGLLTSRVGLFFVWCYATRMRGGYLRFQAQYLRRIRVPDPDALSERLKGEIRRAFRSRDFAALDGLALDAYQLGEMPSFEFVDTRM